MTNDKQRERLVELLKSFPTIQIAKGAFVESISDELADYLLANGIIVPPCKVGDKIYRIVGDSIIAWDIVRAEIYVDEIGFVDDTDQWISLDEIGKTVFLTREEAEQALVTDTNVGSKTEGGVADAD